MLQFLLFFACQLRLNPLFFLCGQKPGFLRAAWQQKVREYTADYSGRSLQNEQPTPIADAEPVHVVEDETRDRSAKDRGNRYAYQEQSNGACLFALRKPVREIQNDSWEVTGFSKP